MTYINPSNFKIYGLQLLGNPGGWIPYILKLLKLRNTWSYYENMQATLCLSLLSWLSLAPLWMPQNPEVIPATNSFLQELKTVFQSLHSCSILSEETQHPFTLKVKHFLCLALPQPHPIHQHSYDIIWMVKWNRLPLNLLGNPKLWSVLGLECQDRRLL